jgi:hypothetical protein
MYTDQVWNISDQDAAATSVAMSEGQSKYAAKHPQDPVLYVVDSVTLIL